MGRIIVRLNRMETVMGQDRARAEIEWQRGRRAHVDPLAAALRPTIWAVIGIVVLEAGLGVLPFWGTLLAVAAVFGSVYLFTREMNEVMRREIEKLSRNRSV